MSRICKQCEKPFRPKGNETICDECNAVNNIMDIIGEAKDEPVKPIESKPVTETAKRAVCQTCGREFEQTGPGRPSTKCPDCRHASNKPKKGETKPKKHVTKLNHIETNAKVTKEEPAKEIKPKIIEPNVQTTWPNEETAKVVADSITLAFKDDGVTMTQVEPYDPVHNPSHYQLAGLGIESKDVIKAALTPEEFKGWCKGNALKYLMRAGKKETDKELQDVAKACEFLSWLN